MTSPLKLWMHHKSQPSRAIMAFCLFNKIPFTPIQVELFKGQHFKPEFKSINALRTVPVIEDNGFLLSESHAILRYLCNSRNLPDHWYPKDPQKRALVDRYLDWHPSHTRIGLRYYQASFKELYVPGWITWEPKDDVEAMKRAYKRIEEVFLENRKYLASDNEMTIADLSGVCEIMQIKTTEFDFSPYKKLTDWLDRCMAHPEMKEAHKEFFNQMDQLKKAREQKN